MLATVAPIRVGAPVTYLRIMIMMSARRPWWMEIALTRKRMLQPALLQPTPPPPRSLHAASRSHVSLGPTSVALPSPSLTLAPCNTAGRFTWPEELADSLPHEPPTNDLERVESLQYGERLTAAEKDFLMSLLHDNRDVFAWQRCELGCTPLVTHEIDTGDAKPIASQAYRHSFREQQLEQQEVDKLLADGLIEPSDSPWSSPIVLVIYKNIYIYI